MLVICLAVWYDNRVKRSCRTCFCFRKGAIAMKRYVCEVCGYVYDEAQGDPDNGVAAGTSWEDVPEDWVCPLCGVGKDQFVEE